LRKEAHQGLALLNIDAALSWSEAGDNERVHTHFELAEEYADDSLSEAIDSARERIRADREQRRLERAQTQQAHQSAHLQVNPLGLPQTSNEPNGWGSPIQVDDADPAEIRARLALTLDGYPDALRSEVPELGAPFARAILDLDDGRTDLALQQLMALPDNSPLVLYERARCAYALKDPNAAARTLQKFAQIAGQHMAFSQQHTGIFLAKTTAEAGDIPQALEVLRTLRQTEPTLGDALYAHLLEQVGQLEEAQTTWAGLIARHPTQSSYYVRLATVQLKMGQRSSAIQTLEACMNCIDCTPGRCGSQPPNPHALRMLATIYLEDGIEVDRGLELHEQLRHIAKPTHWGDAFLDALAAKATQDPSLSSRIEALIANTPEDSVQMKRVNTHLINVESLPAG
jgi:tetratricopeptide (TPR) repeat protein